MPSDPQCSNPDCPMILRRHEDTGIQAVLSAIEGVNARLGSIDTHLMTVTTKVAVHETEIEAIKDRTDDLERRQFQEPEVKNKRKPNIWGRLFN